MNSRFYVVGPFAVAFALAFALSSTAPASAACPEPAEPSPDVSFVFPNDGDAVPADAYVWVQSRSDAQVTIDGAPRVNVMGLPAFFGSALDVGEHTLVVRVGEGSDTLVLESNFTTTAVDAPAQSTPMATGLIEQDSVLGFDAACLAVFRSTCNDTFDDGRYYVATMATEAHYWQIITDQPEQSRLINGLCPPSIFRPRAVDERVCFDVVAINVAGERSSPTSVCAGFGDAPPPPADGGVVDGPFDGGTPDRGPSPTNDGGAANTDGDGAGGFVCTCVDARRRPLQAFSIALVLLALVTLRKRSRRDRCRRA